MIDGKQYVSIAVGWGGVFGIRSARPSIASPGTVYTFASTARRRCRPS
jgi:quinohemoprotein ethanol dehydrogenase